MTFRYLLLLTLLTVATGFSSCQSSRGGVTFTDVRFAVDTATVGRELVLGQVHFRVPRGWNAADSGLGRTKVIELLGDSSGAGAHTPLLFWHDAAQAGMAARMADALAPGEDFLAWSVHSVREFQKLHAGQTISAQGLLVKGVRVVQVMLTDTDHVRFHLLIDAPQPVIVDYSLPQAELTAQLRAVESSIGTIRRIS
jgi:hypothetical protein